VVDRINPIIPGNPDIFPVERVGLPKIDPQEREQRRREREQEREEELREQERQRARRAPRPPRPEGGGSIDVTA
jgi:hypothetical protein